MATAPFHHGFRLNEVAATSQAATIQSTATIGLVATADDADATYFPLNVPVLVTKISEAQGKAGTSGTLAKALRSIADQVKPTLVIVRVAEGSKTAAALPSDATPEQITDAQAADAADQLAKTIGANVNGTYTGAYALLAAEQIAGKKPKVIGAPDLDQPEVVTTLLAIAAQLKSMVYFELHAQGISNALAAAEDYGQREAYPIYGRFLRFDPASATTESISPVGVALGLRAQIDASTGWHKTLSNVVVGGVSGIDPAYAVHFDVLTEGTDADILNEAGIACLIRRDGFRFWGNRTQSEDVPFLFESGTRTAQVLGEAVSEAYFSYLDRPMTAILVRAMIDGINALGRTLVNAGYLHGFHCWYDVELNDTADLKLGKLVIRWKYTPVPPLEDVTYQQEYTDEFFTDFTADVLGA